MGHRLSRIYTRTGDDGSTGLGDGMRVPKEHLRVEAYGTVDEANSALGVVLAVPGLPDPVVECLTGIQHDLFDLGGELCVPGYRIIAASDVERLERALDGFNDGLPPLKDFILPGGGPAAAACHLARTVARRAERRVWALARVGAGRTRGAAVPEPAVRPAVRDRARAGTPRARQRGALAAPAALSPTQPSAAYCSRCRASSSAAHTAWAPCGRRGDARATTSAGSA